MYRNDDLEFSTSAPAVSFSSYALKTFGMMALGLLVTTISAAFFYFTNLSLWLLVKVPYMSLIVFVAQLGVVIAFSSRLFKASVASTRLMFFAYSILTGFTFSVLGWLYYAPTIFLAFGITCIFFASLVVIGYTTRMNLARIAPILFIGLFLVIIFNVLAMFINLSQYEMIACSAGLLIFTGITAYDAQKMKRLYYQYEGNDEMLQRLSMYSALELYLDFINIFLYILRMLGNRRN